MKKKLSTVLVVAAFGFGIAWGLAIPGSAAEPEKEKKAAVQAADDDATQESKPKNIYQEWLDNNHELGNRATECIMCARFGDGFRCGLGCDATGITIYKPDGSTNSRCGRCVKGNWVK